MEQDVHGGGGGGGTICPPPHVSFLFAHSSLFSFLSSFLCSSVYSYTCFYTFIFYSQVASVNTPNPLCTRALSVFRDSLTLNCR